MSTPFCLNRIRKQTEILTLASNLGQGDDILQTRQSHYGLLASDKIANIPFWPLSTQASYNRSSEGAQATKRPLDQIGHKFEAFTAFQA